MVVQGSIFLFFDLVYFLPAKPHKNTITSALLLILFLFVPIFYLFLSFICSYLLFVSILGKSVFYYDYDEAIRGRRTLTVSDLADDTLCGYLYKGW